MIRIIKRRLQTFAHAKQGQKQSIQHFRQKLLEEQYLVFPIKFPIFPSYVYSKKINRYYFEYLLNNNIKYVTAFPLQTEISKSVLRPHSYQHLEKELGLNPSPSKRIKSQMLGDEPDIGGNNFVTDQPTQIQDPPVHYINHIDEIYPIGSICRLVISENNVPSKTQYTISLRSQIRIQINNREKYLSSGFRPLMYVSGRTLKNQNLLQVGDDFKQLLQIYQKLKPITQLNMPVLQKTSITKSIDLMSGFLCTCTYFSRAQLFELFKITNLVERTKLLINYYQNYLLFLQKQWQNFRIKNNENFSQQKKKKVLQDVSDHLQKMLGHPGAHKYIASIRSKLISRKYPENILKTIQCQLQNLNEIGEANPQANRKKAFINLLVEYPFGIKVKETFDIFKAKEILEEDHYGMKKVKERILEFIAVGKLKGQFKSKVLLLYGPPGVGKTSIVQSIAKCLGRPYQRISLGGESDSSILKGHRKTYVGAYPGKIFNAILKCKAENPVILLDQIDKIQTRGSGGSIQDTVMEILDPIQNHKFKDDFVDVEIDLSNVLFICTANTLETIFYPLLDRLERIEVTGYTTHEKLQIFKRYIIRQSMQANGISQQIRKQIVISEQTIHDLIEGYCKEAGVRNLVRKTNQLFQKIAFKIAKNYPFQKQITNIEVQKYLGLPKFHQSRLFEGIPPSGVMIGLAYNSFGGSIMYIESIASNIISQNSPENSHGTFMVTGNIHEVMKQSCQLAFSYAKYVTSTFFNNNFLQINDIHLNFPEIQIGKDGPSAGVAITCALVSLALNKPAIRQIAMTGEITLSGRVSAIGGVKQKTLGAKRQGITHLIFPKENKKDVEQLENQIKQGMKFQFADHFFEVLELVFGVKV